MSSAILPCLLLGLRKAGLGIQRFGLGWVKTIGVGRWFKTMVNMGW